MDKAQIVQQFWIKKLQEFTVWESQCRRYTVGQGAELLTDACAHYFGRL